MKELQELMDHIAKVWKCDEKRYPELAGMNPEQRRNFLVKHSVLHIGKTNGKVAAFCEDADHAGTGLQPSQELRYQAVKMFINALKLAEEVGVGAQELFAEAQNIVQ
jgi:hypothetical protein